MRRKTGPAIVLAIAVIGLLALNPSIEDFKAYAKQKAEDSSSRLFGKLAGEIASFGTNLAYSRSNYALFSVFYTGSKEKQGNRYLGVAKMFIKLDN